MEYIYAHNLAAVSDKNMPPKTAKTMKASGEEAKDLKETARLRTY